MKTEPRWLHDWLDKMDKKETRLKKLRRIENEYLEPFVAAGTISFGSSVFIDTATTYTFMMDWEIKEEKVKKQREKRLKKLSRIL